MFSDDFLKKFKKTLDIIIVDNIGNKSKIEEAVHIIKDTRELEGRLFILGIGGSAANASHAVNDFRKLAGVEAYAPTDNISELTARVNDEGWEKVFDAWLEESNLNYMDTLLVLSVGGASTEKNVSINLLNAVLYAGRNKCKVISIVGKDGGEIKKYSDICILIPPFYPDLVTPITEAMQSVILHLMVTHPSLKINPTKW